MATRVPVEGHTLTNRIVGAVALAVILIGLSVTVNAETYPCSKDAQNNCDQGQISAVLEHLKLLNRDEVYSVIWLWAQKHGEGNSLILFLSRHPHGVPVE